MGLLILTAGLLFLFSLISYHPGDPSLLHQTTAEAGEVRNLIGPAGAHLAAVTLALLGLSAFLVALFLIVLGWRRLRGRWLPKLKGRGVGSVLVLVVLPALLQLTLGRVQWRGGELDAGGVFGRLLAEGLETRLHFAGALLVLLAAMVFGSTLLIQSTLAEILVRWAERGWEAWSDLMLAWARWRERRAKERARERVLAKHLQRAAEAPEAPLSAGGGPRFDLPARVSEKPGEGEFAVRKVRPKPSQAIEAPRLPQPELPFVGEKQRQRLPPLSLLNTEESANEVDPQELIRLGETIRSRCAEFGVDGTIEAITPGPVVTVFEFQPAPGVKVSQIVNLQDDLALAMKAEAVRIDRVPGRSTLGIEVPNRKRTLIRLGTLLAADTFRQAKSVLTMALGTTLHGEPYYADLASMPHLLVAGATGSGKSVGLQSMITSILYKATREDVQFILIDPKRIELGVYGDIPHLKAEVVVDPKQSANALRWAVAEMERRYRLLAEVHVRSIAYYNRAIRDPEVRRRLALSEGDGSFEAADLQPLPYYVIVIDELADLMMVAYSEMEAVVARLAQMARAVGIHLIVATQRPSVDILTGTIKANFPCRVAYATASRPDSRTILDQVGAEKLLGNGDMLFMPPGTSRTLRLHGAYVSEQETAALVRWLKKQGRPELDPEVINPPEREGAFGEEEDDDDELYAEAARLVVAERKASASYLQRRMRIGFSRASRLIDMMERDGLLGPPQGSKPREVLVDRDYFSEVASR